MKLPQIVSAAVLCISARFATAYYDNNNNNNNNYYGYNNNNNNNNNNYYGYNNYNNYNNNNGGNEYYTSGGATYNEYKGDYTGDDMIKYWTEYAVMPKKCIHYGGRDVIVFSMYEKYYNHCKDRPIGTYITDVPTFVNAWVDQLEQNSNDYAGDDYQAPDTTFVSCYPHETNSGAVYYLQIGCTDGNSQSLSINAYKDNTCQTPDKNYYGSDDTSIDISSLQPPFKACHQCVYFVDKNEDDTDDQYFENRMTNAPLCSTVWEYKEKCNGKCKRLGNASSGSGWNKSDKTLLFLFSAFGAVMLSVIIKKRSKMAKKDTLLEEAAMSAAGIQQTHVIGSFALTLIVIAIFGMLGLKTLTWTLLLLVNLVLFSYLMKLTIDAGLNAPVGPDGEPLGDDDSSDEDDDDEDEYEEEDKEKEYKPPSSSAAEKEAAPLPPIS